MVSAGKTVFSIPFPSYVCRHRQGHEDHTGPNVVVSTSVLIAPERWRGDRANAELRAALGELGPCLSTAA